MQNALIYGIVAALSFIGFVSILYFLMLFIYRPKGNSRYIIKIPHDTERGKIESLVYGTYFKKLIFGDLVFDEVEFDKSELSDEEIKIANIIINEMDLYINCKNKNNDNREDNDERDS